MESAEQTAKAEVEHIEGVMDRLVECSENLPDSCRSARCEQEFGKHIFRQLNGYVKTFVNLCILVLRLITELIKLT